MGLRTDIRLGPWGLRTDRDTPALRRTHPMRPGRLCPGSRTGG